MLRARILVRGARRETRRVASIPFSPGMATSITRTSGLKLSASSTAWRPSAASPTTSMSGCAARMSRKPWRTTAWSSASTIVIFLCMGWTLDWNVGFDHESSFSGRPYLQLAADASSARPHPDHAQPLPAGTDLEPTTVVGDQEPDGISFAGQVNRDPRGLRVAGDIRESLLAYPEQVNLHFFGQSVIEGRPALDRDPGPLCEPFREPAETLRQSKVVQNCRVQQLRELPHIAYGLIHKPHTVLDPTA